MVHGTLIKDFDKPYAFKNGYNRVSYLVTLEYPGKDRLAPSILVFRVLSDLEPSPRYAEVVALT